MSTTGDDMIYPSDFQGPLEAHRTRQKCHALPVIEPHLRIIRFRGDKLLIRKDNSSQGSYWHLWVHSRYRNIHLPALEY
jgi:hypothetical protein